MYAIQSVKEIHIILIWIQIFSISLTLRNLEILGRLMIDINVTCFASIPLL